MKNRTSIVQENLNRELGKELAQKRYNAGLTQAQVIDELERREKEALVNLGLSEEEADACIYAEGEELSPELKRKLRKAGIKKAMCGRRLPTLVIVKLEKLKFLRHCTSCFWKFTENRLVLFI